MIRLENKTHPHNKFYEIYENGKTVSLRYGKIDTVGTTLVKKFASVKESENFVAHTLYTKKWVDGYMQIGSSFDYKGAYEKLLAKTNAVVSALDAIR